MREIRRPCFSYAMKEADEAGGGAADLGGGLGDGVEVMEDGGEAV